MQLIPVIFGNFSTYFQWQSPIGPFTIWWCFRVNPFPANVPILDPLKTLERLRFSCVFKGYKMGTLTRNGLIFLNFQDFETYHLHLFYGNGIPGSFVSVVSELNL